MLTVPLQSEDAEQVCARVAADLQLLDDLGLPISGLESFEVVEGVLRATPEPTPGLGLDAFLRAAPTVSQRLDAGVALLDNMLEAHGAGLRHGHLSRDHVSIEDGVVWISCFGLGPVHQVAHDHEALGAILLELLSTPVDTDDVVVRERHRQMFELALALGTAGRPAEEAWAQASAAMEGIELLERDTQHPDGGTRPTAPASVVHERYSILEVLGYGAMGVVYKAWDRSLDRVVALKVMQADSWARPNHKRRFLQEAIIVARLKHPGIVPVYDARVGADDAWMAMAYIRGSTLRARIDQVGRLHWRRAIRLTVDLSRALHHAHEAGVVHRDVKPANILLDEEGHALLTDFGVAMAAREKDTRDHRSNRILGTPAYMSPEQAAGRLQDVGPTADVYSVGAILYEMLCGHAPHDGDTGEEVLHAVLHNTPTDVRSRVPSLPLDVALVCHKALSAEVGDRYASAGELADDAARCLTGEPVRVVEPSAARKLRWWATRSRTTLIAIGLGTMAAASTWQARDSWSQWASEAEAEQREERAAGWLAQAAGHSEELLRGGDAERAAATFLDATRHADVQGTQALVEAWQRQGDRALGRADYPAATSAFAEAFALTSEPGPQVAALVGMGHVLSHHGDRQALTRLLQRISTLEVPPTLAEQVAGLNTELAILQHDLPRAAQIAATTSQAPMVPLLLEVSKATRTRARSFPHQPHEPPPRYDIDGDGIDELLYLDQWLSLASPALEQVATVPPDRVGQSHQVFAFEDDGTRVVFGHSAGMQITRLVDGTWETEQNIPLRPGYTSATSTDLDGDGLQEIYFQNGWSFQRARRVPGGQWVVDEPHPATNRIQSIADRFLAIPGPEPHKLLVAMRGWRAYDLRLFAGNSTPRLTLEKRYKLGTVTGLASFVASDGAQPQIAIARSTEHDNTKVFPASAPHGVDAGIYLIDPTLTDLVPVAPVPTNAWVTFLASGDIDGDGLEDIAYGYVLRDLPRQVGSVILHQGPDGVFRALPIPDVQLIEIADADGDGDDELLVGRDGNVWTLGAGDDHLPIRAADIAPRSPPRSEGLLEAGWSRASTLADLGETDLALRTLVGLAEVAEEQEDKAESLLRAAQIAEAEERHGPAADLYMQAATHSGSPRRLLDASRCLRAASRLEEERTVLKEWTRRTGRTDYAERLAKLEQWSTASQASTFAPGTTEAWSFTKPFFVQKPPMKEGLDIHAAAGAGTLATVDFDWLEGPLVLETILDIERLEWSSSIIVRLTRLDSAEQWNLTFRGTGGGTLLQPTLAVNGPSTTWLEHGLDRFTHPEQSLTIAVRLRLDIDQDATTLVVNDKPLLFDLGRHAPTPGHYRMELVGGQEASGSLVGRLHLKLKGPIRLDHDDADPRDPARRAVVDGRPREALALLDGITDDPVLRFTALRRAGRWREARPILDALLATPGWIDGEGRSLLTWLLREHPAQVVPQLLEVMGDQAYVHVWDVWAGALTVTDGDPLVDTVLTTALDQLDVADPDDERPRELSDVMFKLQLHRGHAYRRLGQLPAARFAHEGALAWHEHHCATQTDDACRMQGTRVRLGLATTLVTAGAQEEAVSMLQEAFMDAMAPEILADKILASAALAPLGADPRLGPLLSRWGGHGHAGLRAAP